MMSKRSLSLSVIVAGALSMGLVGCGSGGGDSSASSNTGTGYYVDSAVAGIDYVCGNQSGVTGVDGNFTFEVGKDCTFSLADVVLREVKAENLFNNVKIVENNVTVATLLQSIDVDGDVNNGIQISNELKEALVETFKTEGIENIPTGSTLDTVVSKLDQNLTDFSGYVRTATEVEDHLQATQTNVVKEMLSGKTFYSAGQSTQNQTDIWGGTVIFNEDMAEVNYTEEYAIDKGTTENFGITSIEGNKIIWFDGTYSIVDDQNKDYILFVDYDDNGQIQGQNRLYYSKANADAYINTIMPVEEPVTPTVATPDTTTPTVTTPDTTAPTSGTLPDVSAYNNIAIIKNVSSYVADNINGITDPYIVQDVSAQTSCADFGFSGTPMVSTVEGVTTKAYMNYSTQRVCSETDYSQAINVSGSRNIIIAMKQSDLNF